MKAAVLKSPGVIEVEEVPTPSPAPGEVLLKVEACALCGTDQRVLAGTKHVDVNIVGHEIAGRVEALGEGVTGVKPGDHVVVETEVGCGECSMCKAHRENLCEAGFRAMGYQFNGGFAEYTIMPREGVKQGCLIPIPDDMEPTAATLIEPLSCCVNGMKYIPFEGMEHVVIFGGGIIGVNNGLVAKARGAQCVTIMDVASDRLALLQRLGLPFDNYVNSRENDPVQWVMEHTGGRGANAVVVAASVKVLVGMGMKMLARAGHLSIFAGMPKTDPVESIDLNAIHYRELNLHGANSSAYEDYLTARDFLVSGKIDGSKLVTHRFSLDDFNKAVQTQADPSTGALKVVVVP